MPLPPAERLGYGVKSAESALIHAKTGALRDLDLTVAQYAALLTLRDNPGISGAGIARACLVTPQAATPILKTLERRGLIRRPQDDWNRAARRTELTPEGARLLEVADERAGAIEQRIYDAFTDAERRQLRALLERFRDAIGTGNP